MRVLKLTDIGPGKITLRPDCSLPAQTCINPDDLLYRSFTAKGLFFVSLGKNVANCEKYKTFSIYLAFFKHIRNKAK